MGSILDKLEHLKETKEKIKQALITKEVDVSDDDTFESYADKIENLKSDPFSYITNALNGTPETITDLIGEYTLQADDLLCPEIEIPEQTYTDDYEYTTIPVGGYRTAGKNNTTASSINYIGFQRVKSHMNNKISIGIHMQKIIQTIVLPDNAYLKMYSVMLGSTTARANETLNRGLIFGNSVAYSTSAWAYPTRSKSDLIIKFPKDFKLTAGETLYLSTLYTTHDVLLEMIENLYDYIGSGEEAEATTNRTISLGTTNLALLSAEEISLANLKGWAIT